MQLLINEKGSAGDAARIFEGGRGAGGSASARRIRQTDRAGGRSPNVTAALPCLPVPVTAFTCGGARGVLVVNATVRAVSHVRPGGVAAPLLQKREAGCSSRGHPPSDPLSRRSHRCRRRGCTGTDIHKAGKAESPGGQLSPQRGLGCANCLAQGG